MVLEFFFFKFTLFAVDSTLTCSFRKMSVENVPYTINQNLETIDHWLNINKIKVNTHKSYDTVFSYRENLPYPLSG